MKDVLNTISKIENLAGMPDIAKGYLESLREQAGALLSNKDALERDLKASKDAKATIETTLTSVQADLEALKKDKPSKSSLDSLDAYKALGTPEELTQLKTRLETVSNELSTTKKTTALSSVGFRAGLFMSTFPDLDVEIQGEGEERKAVFKKGDDIVNLEDEAKSKGLSKDDLSALKQNEQPKGKEALKQEGSKLPKGRSKEEIQSEQRSRVAF